ncbi:MAG: DNA polymerase III subunit alpha [Oscillospiraceae bacterium]
MNSSDFVHLHVHSEYSLLSSACRIEKLIQRTKEMGHTAIALTDYGNLYAAVFFYDSAKKAGLKPILGCECYLAKSSRHDRTSSDNFHIVLLCENNQGYQNLVSLISASNLEGFFHVPRIDFELLRKYAKGLIGLSSGVNGEIEKLLLSGNYEGAKNALLNYTHIFGKENFFLEIQNHFTSDERQLFPLLVRLSNETGINLVATNNVHYLERQDVQALKILHCIRDGMTLDKISNSDLYSGEWYLKSAEEMQNIFRSIPKAIENTRIIAERCSVQLQFGTLRLPKFVKDGVSDNVEYFRKLCYNGMLKRYGQNPSAEILQRLEHELDVIIAMGFTDYFLIVWDFIRYARSQDVPVGPGRGSGAGSLCAYCMGITQIDPIHRQLVFERFLNPERKNMPDFDIDFCIEGRQKVKDYVIRRYGSEHVAEIIAFDTMKAKAALRDVGRVLNMPHELYDNVSKVVDFHDDIQTAVTHTQELQAQYQNDSRVKSLLDTAISIEGMPRHTSTHAAGVVIAPMILGEYVPLIKNDDTIMTQYTMTALDKLGLLKMDFLGLRNLTIIREAERSIQKKHPEFSINQIPLDDSNVYKMIASGNTSGVFQLESAGMRGFLMRLKPENMEDIIAALALYRPGPMDAIPIYIQNRRSGNISYPHPMLKEILSNTYGCIIYQEQVMQIFQKMAGYSLGQADIVRRNMSKKKTEEMEKERQIFLYGSGKNDNCIGAVANGVPLETANHIFDLMANFALYAFNKSHAAAYALLAYQTAYLKYHHSGDYMAALMTSVIHDTEKLASYVEECKKKQIPISPPNINTSESNFIFRDGVIYFSLTAVKGVGNGLSDRIISDRIKNGAFETFADFCKRVSGYGMNKKSLESLIQSGALDCLDYNRRQMLEHYDTVLEYVNHGSNSEPEGQMSLFGEAEISPDGGLQISPMENYPTAQLLEMEKKAMGMYISGHPLDALQWLANLWKCQNLESLQNTSSQNAMKILCTIQGVKKYRTKQGKEMAFLRLEDTSGSMDAVVFAEVYAQYYHQLKEGAIVYITGKMSQREQNNFICESIHTQNDFPDVFRKMQFCIKISQRNGDMAKLQQLSQICKNLQGETELILYLMENRKYVQCKPRIFVNVSENTCQALNAIFPSEKIGLIPAIYRHS